MDRTLLVAAFLAIGSLLIPKWAWAELPPLLIQHLTLVGLALPVAVGLGVGLGLAGRAWPALGRPLLAAAGMVQTVPSVALFGLMLPLLGPWGLGVGTPAAVVALVLYSLLPIMRNTWEGLDAVPRPVLRAARGLGMSRARMLAAVELPLAAPVILAGIRTAVVSAVGVAAVAALVGAGGLGRFVLRGVARADSEMVLAGALGIALLALAADGLLAALEAALTPRTRSA